MPYLISHTIFLLMWGLQILLFGLQDSTLRRRSSECQLCEDNGCIDLLLDNLILVIHLLFIL